MLEIASGIVAKCDQTFVWVMKIYQKKKNNAQYVHLGHQQMITKWESGLSQKKKATYSGCIKMTH